jgi:hypothetical protein
MSHKTEAAGGTRTPRLNLIQLQERYIERVNAAFDRWSHRPKPTWAKAGGHYSRIRRAAKRAALHDLMKWGLTEQQAHDVIRQADEMAELEREARA